MDSSLEKASTQAAEETSNTVNKASSNSCKYCKTRHLKCDNESPACTNCRANKKKCVRKQGVKFKHLLNPRISFGRVGPTGKISKLFANDQPWVKVRKRLHFVDENDSAAFLQDPVLLDDFSYEEGLKSKKKTSIESQKPVQTSQPSSSPLSTTAQQPANTRNSSNSRYNLRHHKTRALSGVSLHEYHHHEPVQPAGLDVGGPEDNGAAVRSISEHLLYSSPGFGDNTSPGLTSDGSPFNVTYSPLSNRVSGLVTNIKLDSSQWCFHDAQEAMLFRYFAQKLAPLFDMCDDERHFAQIVPRRAIFCPPLMNAMLAASAKHLSRVSDFDGLVVEQYHQKCLNVLIPALSSSTAVMDENLLPAVVILRYMEELDVPISTSTLESHLLGTRVFVAAQEELCGYTGLWRAAFWLALRQEIYLAFIQARPVHSSFVLENAEQLIQQDDSGCNYANLMILHCAACMRYCYGSELQDVATWEKLKTRLDALWEERPWMFSPMYEEDGETDVFPVRQYLNDAVVMGVQHHLLAEIIMAAHNPKIPRLGPGQLTATRETDRAIKYNVRLLCGIAESNSCTVPSYVNACVAITMAGDRFSERREQDAFHRVLVKTDTEFGWPTRSAQERMKEAWEWAEPTSRHGMSINDLVNDGLRFSSY